MKLAQRIITAKISLSTYIMASSSLALAIIGILSSQSEDLHNSPFAKALPIDELPWAALLFIGGALTLWGLRRKHNRAILIGAMLSFLMWVFAMIAFSITKNIDTVVVVALPHVIFSGYLYVAASLKTFSTIKGEDESKDGV